MKHAASRWLALIIALVLASNAAGLASPLATTKSFSFDVGSAGDADHILVSLRHERIRRQPAGAGAEWLRPHHSLCSLRGQRVEHRAALDQLFRDLHRGQPRQDVDDLDQQ